MDQSFNVALTILTWFGVFLVGLFVLSLVVIVVLRIAMLFIWHVLMDESERRLYTLHKTLNEYRDGLS